MYTVARCIMKILCTKWQKPDLVDNCLRKIFDVKLTETVRECTKEFNWLTMCDLIDIRKKIVPNYILSENIYGNITRLFSRELKALLTAGMII